jgi:hypothetical protein
MKKRRNIVGPKNAMEVWPAFKQTDDELAHLQETLQKSIWEVRHRLGGMCEAMERLYQKLEQR